ncbi:hypothetical protein KP509_14G053600 [Ceratopteris richardii]|uniref:Uncharacterized protein n=1 Tax=Ceratopteris richardii TaxID=49495 RepID=A0A8T2TA84_CERRI|nr:hypothetical protein KP509_14G053600 [Ceratopteris richardii]
MQARKLSLGEAHPSQVVKVEVDVASQCTAVLLRNSSCLLFPSIAASSPSPSLIIPSCTDICFLRLRQRNTHLSSSSSSEKSADPNCSSEYRKLANVKDKSSMPVTQRAVDSISMGASNGNPEEGSANEALLFLAVRPAKGGESTDLLAWRCNGTSITQTSIYFNGLADGCTARLEDVPHGLSLRISGSINVICIHSPNTGNLCLFSAKESSVKCNGIFPAHVQKGSILNGSVQVDLKVNRGKNDPLTTSCLHISKRAMVDCNGPIYTMHLSFQHLLVGQLGGVRIWALRPLIKGSEMVKRDVKSAFISGKYLCSKQDRIKNLEDEEFGNQSIDISRAEADGLVLPSKDMCPTQVATKNGFLEMGLNHCIGSSSAFANGHNNMGGSLLIKKQNGNCCGKPSADVSICSYQGCMKFCKSADVQQRAISNVSKPIQFEIAASAIPRYRNGFIECDSEEFKIEQKFSQFSTFSSSSDSSSSLPPLQNTFVGSGSCHSSASSLSSVSGTTGTIGTSNKTVDNKGILGGVFIFLQKHKSCDSLNVEQVIGIHGLSEKDFLVLDSSGKLHSLTLQYVKHKGETIMQQAPRVILSASVHQLMCGIRIKYLTVLPDLHRSTKNPNYAERRLWISDGSHTIHIVRMPLTGPSKGRPGNPGALCMNNLSGILRVCFSGIQSSIMTVRHSFSKFVLCSDWNGISNGVCLLNCFLT